MKRGKDDEKIMGPMFPRLHVNDTEKGGPRAPPRNKMALYEQLSIPTQRFSTGVLPLNPSNSSSLVPPVSSSQGNGLERNLLFTHPVHPSTPTHLDEKCHSDQRAGATLNAPLQHNEQSKKVSEEDDFAVPIFDQAGMGQCHDKSQSDVDKGNLSCFNPSNTPQSTKFQNACDKNPKRSSSSSISLRQQGRHICQENPKICISIGNFPAKSSVNLSIREKIDGIVKEVSASPNQEYTEIPGSDFSRINDSDASLRLDSGAGLPPNGCCRDDDVDSTGDFQKEVVPQPRGDTHSTEDCGHRIGLHNDSRYHVDKTCGSPQLGSGDKSDDVSETSMVDSMSGVDISPDDVVGIIGHKHFWKARRAIVNQQRVFAVQVFELHRLIKVQQLIAESPDVLLEESACLAKPSLKASPAKKLPSEFVVKPLPHGVKRKVDSEKPNHKIECSAENAVGKTSLSSVKNGSQPSNYGPYRANQPPPMEATNSRMAHWCFHQSPGQQWLIPVMSPSEGLIYKPYPGPGFMGTVCGGGCSPFGPTPLTGNFMHPDYGITSPNPLQGNGAIPGAHLVGHGYFPHYGMPVMNPSVSGSTAEQENQFAEQENQFAVPGSRDQFSQGDANFYMPHESSCNVPAQKNGAVPLVRQFQASKDTELQGSTASSPAKRVQGDGMGHAAEVRDALQLSTVSPVVQEAAPQPHDADQPTKVIKVVPHNPRSATESVARIFRSIQEERKQYDSI